VIEEALSQFRPSPASCRRHGHIRTRAPRGRLPRCVRDSSRCRSPHPGRLHIYNPCACSASEASVEPTADDMVRSSTGEGQMTQTFGAPRDVVRTGVLVGRAGLCRRRSRIDAHADERHLGRSVTFDTSRAKVGADVPSFGRMSGRRRSIQDEPAHGVLRSIAGWNIRRVRASNGPREQRDGRWPRQESNLRHAV
jgi:hypothetical protein